MMMRGRRGGRREEERRRGGEEVRREVRKKVVLYTGDAPEGDEKKIIRPAGGAESCAARVPSTQLHLATSRLTSSLAAAEQIVAINAPFG